MAYIIQKTKTVGLFMLQLACTVLSASAGDVSITATGAIGDGRTDNTAAIQRAIDSCHRSGGGRVTVPRGVFVSGGLVLYSYIELHLQAGAVLKGSTRLADYPLGCFLKAKGCTDVQLTGTGTLDGSGQAFYNADFQPLPRPQPFLLFDTCTFVRIRDIKLIQSPAHAIRLVGCQQVVVDGIYMDFPERSPNTDGIDIVDSRDVHISNSTLITGDDAICLKCHKGKVENVTITNCVIQSDDGGIKLGTGSNDTIQHCTFSNVILRNTRFALAMFMQEGGVYRFINFNNITIQNGGRQENVYPIYIDVDKKRAEEKLGLVEHIQFGNIQAETYGNILIAGQPTAPLRYISLHNITLLVRNCADLSSFKKPRGNRNTPVFADTKDLSSVPAHITLGYIRNLQMSGVKVVDECTGGRRTVFHKTDITEWP
jgi:polygalacturonase